jgi:ergothioneine biosynthesis protein EgtB
LVDDLSDEEWRPALQRGINPVAWELAHLAWFAEFWILRGPHAVAANGLTQALQPARFLGPDEHLDSAQLAHAARWTTPMRSRAELKDAMARQLQACVKTVPVAMISLGANEDKACYFHRLALFHEDMHAEAFCWMRSALGYSAPAGMTPPKLHPRPAMHVAAASAQTGWTPSTPGFAFDNEMPGNVVALEAFDIDGTVLSAAQFASFVNAGGYNNPSFWPADAGAWRTLTAVSYPEHWRKTANGWEQRWFDRWLPVTPELPLMHITAHEAEAYCLWAGRALPSAAQWEHAAAGAAQAPGLLGDSFDWGHSVWEWTSNTFAPYPGFTPGPYKEYSQPWFGNHRELRGGAFATHARLHHPRYRNFFQAHRADVFSGFRTVSL